MSQQASLPSSRYLKELPPYPFARLDVLRAEVEARGIRVIDLGIGDPHEPTPDFVKLAMTEAIPEESTYPRVNGVSSLREAFAGWLARRFGAHVDPEREVLPVNGSKEAIFNLPLAVLDPVERPLALVPDPAYPVYALGTRAFGGEVYPMPLRPDHGFLPDLRAIPEEVWRRTSILWINYPNNPTGAVAPASFLAEAVVLARRHGVLLVSDEAYSETYFDDPPPSPLQWGTENILALYSLSKRSGMAGYRSGMMAGDVRLIDALKRVRPGLGVATPDFIQAAAHAAWADDAHVEGIRERFRRRRDLVVAALNRMGYAVSAPPATFYLWIPVPSGMTSDQLAARWLEAGVVVLPGSGLGAHGEGYVRLAVSSSEDVLREAMDRIARAMS
jgi:succinyldiaminopimelate transaminase